jgi:hypothetical protein
MGFNPLDIAHPESNAVDCRFGMSFGLLDRVAIPEACTHLVWVGRGMDSGSIERTEIPKRSAVGKVERGQSGELS